MKWVDALFAKFTAIWGAKWVDHQAAVQQAILAAEWREGLAGVTAEQLRAGIAHCRHTCAWPPSIAEFRAACGLRDEPTVTRSGAHALYLPTPPRSQAAREAAARHLEAIRAGLPTALPQEPEGPGGAEMPTANARRAFVARRAGELAAAGLGRFVAEAAA